MPPVSGNAATQAGWFNATFPRAALAWRWKWFRRRSGWADCAGRFIFGKDAPTFDFKGLYLHNPPHEGTRLVDFDRQMACAWAIRGARF